MKEMMLKVAASGYHVFPLLDRFRKGENKAGTPPGWNHNKKSDFNSSNDVEVVQEWSELKDLIGYGINPRDKNVFILDVDSGKNEEALVSLQILQTTYNLEKPNLIVKSRSGGYHFYFAHPEFDVISSIGALPGIDLRCNNSYVRGPDNEGPWEKGSYSVISGSYTDPLKPLSEDFTTFLKSNHTKKKFTDSTSSLVLPENVTKKVIFNGEIPEVIQEGERHITLLRLIGNWVRCGYPRNNIIALLRDAFKVCEGKPGNIDDYIQRIDDTMAKVSFNRKTPEPLAFFLENAIHIKEHDGVFEVPSRKLFVKGLLNIYAHLHYYVENDKGKQIKIYAYKEWLEHPQKKIVNSIGYKPVEDEIIFYDKAQNGDVANLYVGPVLPDVPYEDLVWAKFENFAKWMFGEKADFMLDWAAHIVQRPWDKLQFAIALISEERGVGKNLFLKLLSGCIGIHNAVELTLGQLFDSHVEYPLSKHLVIINEANRDMGDVYNNKKQDKVIEEMKTLITEDYVSVNPKFVRISSVTSYVNYIFTSNNVHSIPIDEKDRRFEIVIIDELKKGVEFYKELFDILDSSRKLSTIRKGLLRRKITKVNKSYSPSTIDSMKQLVIDTGKNFIDSRIEDDIRNKNYIFKQDIVTQDLFGWYVITHISTLTQAICVALFRKYCKPIYRPKTDALQGNKPRALKVLSPSVEYKGGDFRNENTNVKNIYTCRDFNKYKNHEVSSAELLEQYNENLKAAMPGKLSLVAGGKK